MRDPILTERAKSMRKSMTEPETRIWLAVRAERFSGVKFRRQKVIGPYIVDFAANQPKLVIEIDGDSHAEQEGYDAARTQFLEHHGYTVIRFTNSEVMTNMEGMLERVTEVISQLRCSPPSPNPLPCRGEG